MSLIALVAAMRPKSYGSSTIGIKKSVVDTTPRSSSRAYTAASSREALPTHSLGSRFCAPLPARITSSSFGEIWQPQPAPWLYWVKRIGSLIGQALGKSETGADSSRRMKNVGEAGKTRQKRPRKRSLRAVNEHSEAVFNAGLPTQVVFQRSASKAGLYRSAPYNRATSTTLTTRRPAHLAGLPFRYFSAIEPENLHAQTYPGARRRLCPVPVSQPVPGCRNPARQRHSGRSADRAAAQIQTAGRLPGTATGHEGRVHPGRRLPGRGRSPGHRPPDLAWLRGLTFLQVGP